MKRFSFYFCANDDIYGGLPTLLIILRQPLSGQMSNLEISRSRSFANRLLTFTNARSILRAVVNQSFAIRTVSELAILLQNRTSCSGQH